MATPFTRNVVQPVELGRLSAITAGKEQIRYELYDSLTYTSGTTTRLTFFQQTSQAAGGIQFNNLQLAGTLPAPFEFVLTHFRLWMRPGVATTTASFADDHWALFSVGAFEFFAGAKPYQVVAPLMYISSGFSLVGWSSAATTNTATTITNNYADNGHPLMYKVDPPLFIPSQLNFSAVLSWSTPITLPSATNPRVYAYLGGYLLRPVQ